MSASVETSAPVDVGDITLPIPPTTVATGGYTADNCPVYASITYNGTTPTIANRFYFDNTGNIIIVSQGQTFQKNAALKPQIDWACLYLNDTTNDTAREVMQRTITACDAAGNVTSTTVDLFEMDRTTAVTALGTEVLSKDEQCFALGEETVASGAALTVPAGANGATVQVDPDGSAIRYTFDGSAPTDDSFAASPGSWITVCKPEDLAGFTTAAADAEGAIDATLTASLRVHYVSTELH